MATVQAVRQQHSTRKIVACIEIHTFSSLSKEFMCQYEGTMDNADYAFVYFNPEAVEHKKMEPLSPDDVQRGFGEKVRVFTDTAQLITAMKELPRTNVVYLLMTSGNFGGLDIQKTAKELIEPLS